MGDVKSALQTLIANRSTPHNKQQVKYFAIRASSKKCALDVQIPQNCAVTAIENAGT